MARPICVPPDNFEVDHGTTCIIAGWGQASKLL